MKIVDFDVADAKANNTKRKLQFPQKYVLLELGNEVYELEIADMDDSAFYLRIKEDKA